MRHTLALLLASGVAATANAAYISFASDTNHAGPTFISNNTQVPTFRDGGPATVGGKVALKLLVDADEDGPGPAVSYDIFMNFNATLTNYNAHNFAGSWIHEYTAFGRYEFVDANSGALLLGVNFNRALFTSWSATQGFLGTSATLQSNLGPDDDGQYEGSLVNQFSIVNDWAFTLTNLRATSVKPGDVVPVGNDGSHRYDWKSEGSYSATLALVPAPGALALAGLGGLIAARRRRA